MKIFHRLSIYNLISFGVFCSSSLLTDIANSQSAIAHNLQHHPLVRKHIPQIRRMRKVKRSLPLVMPTYIPRRFRLADFLVDDGIYPSYTAVYKGANACEFTIGAGVGGWGGGPGDIKTIVNTKLFGKVELNENLPGHAIALIAEVTPGSRYRPPIKGFPYAGYIFYFECKNKLFSIQEASKILQSMQMFNL